MIEVGTVESGAVVSHGLALPGSVAIVVVETINGLDRGERSGGTDASTHGN